MPRTIRHAVAPIAVLALLLAVALIAGCGGDDGGPACNDADCITPPPNFCDGDIAWTFVPFGACSGDTCSYSPSSTTCEFGCSGGSCDDPPDLCEDVDCSAPEPSCDGDQVYIVESDGRCNPDTGACEFTDVDIEDCTEGGEICVRTDRGPECFLPQTHCSDGLRNGGETAIDCGGPNCPGCRPGSVCFEASDCRTGVCEDGLCAASSCTDSVLNGSETDRDCGGACRPCRDNLRCLDGADCANGVCIANACAPATCIDGVRNGNESDVDCGGSCAPCERGLACTRAADCESRSCRGDRCRAPACDDFARNGDETDTDCGGDTCRPCDAGLTCDDDADCVTGWCNGSGVCATRSCDDGLMNGPEIDVDCGDACGPCEVDQRCTANAGCLSGVCQGGFCAPPSCIDRVRNGDETDIDCGGDDCVPCEDGERCRTASDCAGDGRCIDRVCVAPTCDDAVQNARETAVDCGGADCPPCGRGRTCLINDDCITGICTDEGICDIDRSCFDGVRNEDETDVDCGGDECLACRDGWACDVGSDCFSGVCALGTYCAEATCDDGVMNGLESDIDCGGPCGLIGCPADCPDDAQVYDLADFQRSPSFWQHTGDVDRPTFESEVPQVAPSCDEVTSTLGYAVYYRFDVLEAGTYAFAVNASARVDSDVDANLYVTRDSCIAPFALACDASEVGGSASVDLELEPGVYFAVVLAEAAEPGTSTYNFRVFRTR